MPGCILPLKRTSTDSGMSSGITPVAAAKATRPEPAGKLMPIGKRVCAVGRRCRTVSGSSRRFSQEWITPSPTRSDDAAAVAHEGRQLAVRLDVDRLRVRRRVAEALHHQIGAEAQAGEILQLVARHRAGGVLASRRWSSSVRSRCRGARPGPRAGRRRGRPSSAPACSRVVAACGACGRRNAADAGRPRNSRALAVSERPMIRLMRPPARTSSSSTSLLQLELGDRGSVLDDLAVVAAARRSRRPSRACETSTSIGSAPESSCVLKKIGAILAPSVTPPNRLFGHERDVLRRWPRSRCWWRSCASCRCRPRRRRRQRGGPCFFSSSMKLDRAALAVFLGLECGAGARVLQHRQVVQRDVGPAPRIGRRRQVVGVGLARSP